MVRSGRPGVETITFLRRACAAAAAVLLLSPGGPARAQAGHGAPAPRTGSFIGATIAQSEPEFSPRQLVFDAVSDGQTSRRTLSLSAIAGGTITAQAPGAPFRIAEFRVVSHGIGSQRALAGPSTATFVKSRITYTEAQTGPYQWNVTNGEDIQIDVVFAPRFDLFKMAAGEKTASLRVSGPGPRTGWSLAVPLQGMFNGLKIAVTMALAPREIIAVEGSNTVDAVATITGVDGATGTLEGTTLPLGVSLTPVPVTVPKGQTVKPTLPLHIDWTRFEKAGIGHDVEVTFKFAGGSSKASLSLVGLPGGLYQESKKRTGCGVQEFNITFSLSAGGTAVLILSGFNNDEINRRNVWAEARTGSTRLVGGVLTFYERKSDEAHVTVSRQGIPMETYRAAVRNGVTLGCQLVEKLGPPEAQ